MLRSAARAGPLLRTDRVCTARLALSGACRFCRHALLILWTLTTHHSAWANANLLLFNPLAFLLLRALWRSRRGSPTSRFTDGLIVLQLLAVLAAVLLHLLPGVVQQNQPWLLFALPCWLALAWSLRRNDRERSGRRIGQPRALPCRHTAGHHAAHESDSPRRPMHRPPPSNRWWSIASPTAATANASAISASTRSAKC